MKVAILVFISILYYLTLWFRQAVLVIENSRSGNYPDRNSYLSVKVLDVGQGDSILITTPSGKRVLIDGGPDYTVDGYLLREFPFQPCHIDKIILTHDHSDHSEGLERVLKHCSGTFYQKADRSDSFTLDGVNFEILWPPDSFAEAAQTSPSTKAAPITDENDLSVVIFLDWKDFEALFVGDAGSEVLGELDWSSVAGQIDKGLDLYKVSHHGSNTGLNKTFLRKIDPEYSVISVGNDNSFGHPHQEVLLFLEDEIDSRILRTDQDGTVEMRVY